jgi:hypothetical protein
LPGGAEFSESFLAVLPFESQSQVLPPGPPSPVRRAWCAARARAESADPGWGPVE